jgi:GNAT superfamily N-acetyltransferase
MARRLRALMIDDLGTLPAVCGGCAFWESGEAHERRCGSVCDPEALREWYERVHGEWGECGRVALDEDDAVIGFIKYAPSRYFPQAGTFPSHPLSGDTVLITCLHIRDDAREQQLGRLLVQAALRDLKSRGERTVQSFGCAPPADLAVMPMIGMKYLLNQGFTVVRPDPAFPLLQLDLRSLAMFAENLEAMLESLRIPLRSPARIPGPTTRAS